MKAWRKSCLNSIVGMIVLLAGCDAISIMPSCPRELAVGESGPVQANEVNPGAIATYLWEAFPATAGSFADPTMPTTSFEAITEGDVTLRLTASDGLYQVISTCVTRILDDTTSVEVSFDLTSMTPREGDLVAIACMSVGETAATTFMVTQTSGAAVGLSEPLTGVFLFTATEAGDLQFECVGESADGQVSAPATLDVTVVPGSDNSNGNSNDNTNDNGTAPPPGGGRR